jgi:hypothetical protein
MAIPPQDSAGMKELWVDKEATRTPETNKLQSNLKNDKRTKRD